VFTLESAAGVAARVIPYGGIVMSLRVPDRHGAAADVVLGFDEPGAYRSEHPYFGALVGRYANRIAGGRFTLDGAEYPLACNNGPNHLHGGTAGFDRALWEPEPFEGGDRRGVTLRHTSVAGDEGYPGTLDTRATYTLTDAGELIIDYHAVTDAPTPVNLTHHGYFNLAGHDAGDVLDHVLTIDAERFTPVDAALIPTGELRPVEGTPFDFREPARIGARIDEDDGQLRVAGGYDHNFVLRKRGAADRPTLAARVVEPDSGRVLEVLTTEPGLQLYTGNFLDGIPGKDGATYGPRSGLALETQHFPDSPNRPAFPATILRPGAEYVSRTIFRFTTTEDR